MGRHRLQVDGDVVAAVGWWGAILTGLVLVGLSADQELRHDVSSGRTAVTVPDVIPAPDGGGGTDT
ncbi:hypothetical protein [Streptomyces sp. NPDC059991]|uniref:hypothetical protein n=1 Tax=unclassified Streptomyces TaxID=2593676 RepID=UPI003698CC15